jgi:hypothetical protein
MDRLTRELLDFCWRNYDVSTLRDRGMYKNGTPEGDTPSRKSLMRS